jgi:mannobiose 2-epimerase
MTRSLLRCCAFSLVLLVAPGLAQDDRSKAEAFIPQFEKALEENIVRFWYPRCLDRNNGGYIINFGPRGEPKSEDTKMIVTQARMLWLFARLARGGYQGPGWGRKELLEAAEWGYRFLKEKMWDHENGGFYWEVDATGDRKLRPRKHLYGQSFGLYALAEYYLASNRKDVLDFAVRFFNLLEGKAHDETYGGYIESFNEDWASPPDGEPSYMRPTGLKLMNTHLHLLEAMTTFYRAGKLPLARERLLELITIESSTVVRKELGACTDKYTRDWGPRLEGDYARVSYGHDLENIWLLMEANDAAGLPNAPLLDLYRTLFAYSLKHGYDQQNGGFFDSGLPREPADRQNKTWWVQAEVLVSALRMYEMTRDPTYWRVFAKTWNFVNERQIDWETGEWHATITPAGKASGDKATIWKAGYHNGRALIECLELLKEWAKH